MQPFKQPKVKENPSKILRKKIILSKLFNVDFFFLYDIYFRNENNKFEYLSIIARTSFIRLINVGQRCKFIQNLVRKKNRLLKLGQKQVFSNENSALRINPF